MGEQFFTAILGTVILFVSGSFIVLSSRSIWQWLNHKSLEFNPIRRFFRRKFPRFDYVSMSWGRVFMRVIGIILAVLSAAILGAIYYLS